MDTKLNILNTWYLTIITCHTTGEKTDRQVFVFWLKGKKETVM